MLYRDVGGYSLIINMLTEAMDLSILFALMLAELSQALDNLLLYMISNLVLYNDDVHGHLPFYNY